MHCFVVNKLSQNVSLRICCLLLATTMLERFTKKCRLLMSFVVISMCCIYYANIAIHVHFEQQETPHKLSGSDSESRVLKVLIVAYYRSGSTLTGELFNFNPSTLYWYEPLAAVTEQWGWHNEIIPTRNFFHFDNGTRRPVTDDTRQTLLSPIRDIFNCNITDERLLRHGFMTGKTKLMASLAMIPYKKCLKVNNTTDKTLIPKCLPLLTAACQSSSLIAVKVIRLRMEFVENLLQSDPDIRVIHLVRDPRGLLRSWWMRPGKYLTTGNIQRQKWLDAKLLCQQMLTDCEERKRLERLYAGRLLMIRYEDLATDPERVVQQVYSGFLHRPVSTRVVRELRRLEYSGRDDGRYGTKRKNANETAFLWKKLLKETDVENINNFCSHLIAQLSYNI